MFRFNGGCFTIRLQNWHRSDQTPDTIQTLDIEFPPTNDWMPLPQHISVLSNADDSNKQAVWGTFPSVSANTSITTTQLAAGNAWRRDHYNFLNLNKRFQGNEAQRGTEGVELLTIRPGDIVLGVGIDPNGPTRGDFRKLMLENNVESSWFAPHPSYHTPKTAFANLPYSNTPSGRANLSQALLGRFASAVRSSPSSSQYDMPSGGNSMQFGWRAENPTSSINIALNTDQTSSRDEASPSTRGTLVPGVVFRNAGMPVAAYNQPGALMSNNRLGDWTSGTANMPDGGFFRQIDTGRFTSRMGGYFERAAEPGASGEQQLMSFEPMRQVSSPGMFSGILTPDSNGNLAPWQTLLFTPSPAAGFNPKDYSGFNPSFHYGFASPADHYLLDLFWMPACEPYPISDRLSTAGKVNLNQQLMPFINIERTTSLRGALRPTLLAAVEDSEASTTNTYKWTRNNSSNPIASRYAIDGNQTIIQFKNRFNAGELFRTATEVSEIPLIPEGQTGATISNWWSARRITSDTLREQPYVSLLSRVTTKSNTFTVHYRVQALRQPPRTGRSWAEWDEARDQVVGEYRGATTIERFLDPNAQNIPDYTQVNLSGNYDPIDKFYRWRVLSQKQFAP
jgi:uncharacterized protein (TIGR02600 family)